ncbi:uncharacterized protein EI90DRAFT_3048966 [Cantharellus anzutake]|uniref:uncharacterized protein n=1 Tax=Cantharellus anzutake TaxID=1750568 RepID=UPI001902C58E|nr:uncharacterized protein EI90DRAFT_3089765 [Cantharellus anzutake]XP_038918364.1 uncharacterized protein EI90DRAFT_3048966 [Cantharellus anzutake]KAF8314638.1 hypothetical protein EI90DRAFT_3089765 [Cantharellus anzutake]KAF8334936.1 hypothetical protein EI90DRAFT_3048966 [Cantharellus anzutake]
MTWVILKAFGTVLPTYYFLWWPWSRGRAKRRVSGVSGYSYSNLCFKLDLGGYSLALWRKRTLFLGVEKHHSCTKRSKGQRDRSCWERVSFHAEPPCFGVNIPIC